MFRSGVACLVATFVGACAYNDRFENRADRFDVAASQARDTMILTNIIRASHGEPLSFFQLGKVTGVNSAQATAGLPALVFGPHVSHAANAATAALQSETIFGASAAGGQGFVGNSAQIAGSTTFEVNPQETKDFYRGLLSEVEPRTLEFFIRQGVSRELLFYLFTDRLVVAEGGRVVELRNDPLDPAMFARFQRNVRLAMDYGVRSEFLANRGKSAGGEKRAEGKSGRSDRGGGEENGTWRLCFDPLLMRPGLKPANNAPVCGEKIDRGGGDNRTVRFTDARGDLVHLSVLPRSTFAIFQFLGRVVAAGERGRITLHSAEAIDAGPLRDEYLFSLDGDPAGGCYLTASDADRTYCVPRVGGTNTKRIIGLLTQLIALNTSIADVPVTPTVRVIQ